MNFCKSIAFGACVGVLLLPVRTTSAEVNHMQNSLSVVEAQPLEVSAFVQDFDIRARGIEILTRSYDPSVEEKILWSEVPPDGEGVCRTEARTYMDYRSVHSRSSDQYKLLYSDLCYTNPENGLRMVGDRYCIAVGTHYAYKIGTKINVVMANGSTVKCILGDVKADEHTDPTHRYQRWDGSVVECIIDGEIFHDISQYPPEFVGKIARIDIVDDNCSDLVQRLGLTRDWIPNADVVAFEANGYKFPEG